MGGGHSETIRNRPCLSRQKCLKRLVLEFAVPFWRDRFSFISLYCKAAKPHCPLPKEKKFEAQWNIWYYVPSNINETTDRAMCK